MKKTIVTALAGAIFLLGPHESGLFSQPQIPQDAPKLPRSEPRPREQRPKAREMVHNDYEKANAHVKKADEFIRSGRNQEALKELENAERAAPSEGWYAARTGHTLSWYMSQPEAALAAFDRADSKGFRHPWVLRERGIALFRTKKFSEAASAIRDSIDLALEQAHRAADEGRQPDAKGLNVEAVLSYGWLAAVLVDTGEYSDAAEAAKKGYALVPDSNDWYLSMSTTRAAVWLGHEAFARGDYDAAAQQYDQAESVRTRNPDVKKYTEAWQVKVHAELARRRKALGEIKPDYVHRIRAINVDRVDLDFKSAAGQSMKASGRLTSAQREKAILFQGILTRYVETMSGGRMSITFQRTDFAGTIKELNVFMWNGSVETRIPVWETVSPDMGDLLFDEKDSVDSFAFYWNGEGAATTANGGALAMPYVPYQMYGPARGFMSIPANWVSEDAPIVLFHEFFHVIEGLAGITPTHGFQDESRRAFPGWKGQGQLDYFRWQFATTLPRILNDPAKAAKPDWKNMSWTRRYKDPVGEDIFKANLKAVSDLKLNSRREAAALMQKAAEKRAVGSEAEAAKLTAEALRLNGVNPDALWFSAKSLEEKREWDKAAQLLERLAALRPAVWLFNHLGWIHMYQRKKPADAVSWYERARTYDPDSPDLEYTFVSLGRAKLDMGQVPGALEEFDGCAKYKSGRSLPPVWAQCTFWKGYTIGEKMGNATQAYPFVKQAVDAGFSDQFVLYYLNKFAPKSRSVTPDSGGKAPALPVSPRGREGEVRTGEFILHGP